MFPVRMSAWVAGVMGMSGIAGLGGVAAAAVLTHDFSGTAGTTPAGWTRATVINTGSTTLTPFTLDGNGRYTHTGSASNDAQLVEVSGFQIANREAGTNFSISTQFSHPTASLGSGGSGYNASTGLRFLASGATVEAEAAATFYQLMITRDNAGNWDLILSERAGGAIATRATVEMDQGALLTPLSPSIAAYTLSVTGTYLPGGNLQIDFGLNNGTLTRSGTFTDTTPVSGNHFGIRTRWRAFANTTSTFSDSYDTLTVDYTPVPEPTMGLALVSVGGLLLRRHPAR